MDLSHVVRARILQGGLWKSQGGEAAGQEVAGAPLTRVLTPVHLLICDPTRLPQASWKRELGLHVGRWDWRLKEQGGLGNKLWLL